ncbi:class I SAM-dependent methyltransferase [Metallosphaera hakonensis]|uniref:Methyltransferase domain-containing protein n=1 Tax=Metallosphaera hakonensis JCM 8857 = DSM 7519 TaxID=1293036 RepID=A0A2U9IS77_9CREN|nr:class I SAM-dependent methyltransferase [Metallosphaera hakonensis]AWR98889.1 methyltransferase domain-containing protein [Metallosphaera hakonensis JCM 8857 = DSM 7519]
MTNESFKKIFESDFYINEMVKVWEEGKRWADWVNELSSRFNLGRKVLDVPCGIGRVSYYLAQEKFDVTGLDISERMLDMAKKNVPSAKFLKGDMRMLEKTIGDEKYDIVVNLFNSLGYYSEEDDMDILVSIKNVTKGVAVINIDNRDYVIFNMPETRYSYIPPYMVVDNSRFDPLSSRVETVRKYLDSRGNEVGSLEYSQRYYSLHEIAKMAKRAGFKLLDIYSGYSWKPFDIGDPQMTIVLSPVR